MSEQTTLDTSFIKQGIDFVSFWNGRVLTAEDLRDEQLANDAGRRRLGRAMGAGIGSGLTVAAGPADNQVTVNAGVAINGLGQALELPVDIEVALTVPIEGISSTGVFAQCDDVPSATPTGSGLYMLVLRPASDTKGEAPGVTTNGNGVGTECGPRYSVDGVSFRLVGIDAVGLATATGHDAADLAALASIGSAAPDPLLRNVIAHVFLDTIARRGLFRDPFAPAATAEYGVLAQLPEGAIAECEVPLALVSWASGRVDNVDAWPVRRPVLSEVAAASALEAISGSRPRAEGAAAFRQFQEQLVATVAELNPLTLAGFSVTDRFRYLPAVGVVPLAAGTTPSGFVEAAFFNGLIVRTPVPISAAQVGPLLDASYPYPPIDLASGEVVYVYRVRRPPPGEGEAADPSAAYIVFCSNQLPFLGDELVIDAVIPAGALHVGQQIEILGRGFGFTEGLTRVSFGPTAAAPQPGSTDTKLVVIVPTSLVVPEAGLDVTIEVDNGTESDSVAVHIERPEQPVLGDIDVTWLRVEPATLEALAPGDIVYAIRSRLNQTNEVVLQAAVTPTSMQAGLSFRDAAGDPLAGDRLLMAPDDSVEVVVRFEEIADVATFNLIVTATAQDITGESDRDFEVGTETLPSDPAITLAVNDFDLQPGASGSLVGTTVTLADGSLADIEITAELTEPGDYQLVVDPTSTVAPWGSILAEPPDGLWENITQAEIGLDGAAGRIARVTVGNLGATTSGALDVIVQRVGAPLDARIAFTLVVE